MRCHSENTSRHSAKTEVVYDERISSNDAFKNYTRAFGDGPRKFESWSRDVDDTRAGTSSLNYHITPTGGRFSSGRIQRASLPYTAGL
ncbi:hypothetical protein TNCV_2182301 [Trichonephila clavipes]|uniref:Uncharacterized protein n=1 Tax=Trichonephila clavipes TaxID=2585209 RepID=A0A8X7B9D3_TRICX|nr:hypothetical protein TNCV_2182301 [Trichonephila clavipes]